MAYPPSIFGGIPNLRGTIFSPPQGRTDMPGGRRPSILDRILGLYGSDPSTHIPGARGEALRRGLFQGGANVLAGNVPGHGGLTSAQGLGVALQSLGQAGPQMAAEQKQLQLQQLLSSGATSPAQIQMMATQALAAGDYKTAQILQQILQTQMAAESAKAAGQASKARGLVTQLPSEEDGQLHNVLLDPTNGQVLRDLGPALPDKGVVVDSVDASGKPIKVLVNPRTGERISTYSQPEKPPTPQEEQLATRAKLVEMAVNDVDAAIAKLGRGPNFVEWNAYKHDVTRAAVPNDVQGLLQAEEALVSHLAVVVTGSVRAAASQPIRDAIFRSYLVAPGDSPLNREQTLRNLRAISERLKTQAGRAWIREQAGITQDMIDALEGGDSEAEYGGPGEIETEETSSGLDFGDPWDEEDF